MFTVSRSGQAKPSISGQMRVGDLARITSNSFRNGHILLRGGGESGAKIWVDLDDPFSFWINDPGMCVELLQAGEVLTLKVK